MCMRRTPRLPRCRGTALRMAATDDDAPADVFFSVKQRLQKCNIWLIGMDGSDKQIVGQALAKKLGYKFMDTNEIIAALLKQPVEKAIEAVGEEEFVKVERAVLDQVQAYYGTVISTGSMAPSFPENWSKFRTGLVAYCKVPPEGVKKEGLQAALADEAPLLEGMPAENQMELLLAQRELKYSQADVTVSLTGSENLEDKLLAVAEGLRVFVVNNPASDAPVLGEAHARAISRTLGLGTAEKEGADADMEAAKQKDIERLKKMMDEPDTTFDQYKEPPAGEDGGGDKQPPKSGQV